VKVRSRIEDKPDADSLGFTSAAKPPDDAMLGLVPDALIPVDLAPAWAPYPLQIAPGERGIVWIEAFVPEHCSVGAVNARVRVSALADDTTGELVLGEIDVNIDVLDAVLPYRAASFFAYYERSTLEARFVDAALVERQVWQTLHAHHLDVMVLVTSPADIEEVRGGLSGEWFTKSAGYVGPGIGEPSSLLALGSYGMFREPSPAKVEIIREMAALVPPEVDDLFVYAIDEQCDSPYGGRWRQLLRAGGVDRRVLVGHTCHLDPRAQDVDLVMMPAQAFDPDLADAARAIGKKVWIYNGQLPFAGPPNLDVPLTSLTANGWIAGSFDIGRWLLWETTFWNDGNRGGRGPRDVFADPETFHNWTNDASLYDGLLLFPGRQPKPLAHSLEVDAVFPSLRLKALRRGIQDAGLLALAAEIDAPAAFEISERVIPAVLDEVDARSPTAMSQNATAFADARGALRRIIARSDAGTAPATRSPASGLSELRRLRLEERARTGRGEGLGAGDRTGRDALVMLGLPLLLLGAGVALASLMARTKA
jgi:hypothetical protein